VWLEVCSGERRSVGFRVRVGKARDVDPCLGRGYGYEFPIDGEPASKMMVGALLIWNE
jgi:hypothetical protein